MRKKTWIGIIAGLVLLGGTGGAGERPEGGGPKTVPMWETAYRVAFRVKGRFLGNCIKKGMTEDEVKAIVTEAANGGGSGLFGGIIVRSWHYYRLGLGVMFDNTDPGTGYTTDTMRVVNVTFWPLFD